MYVDDLEIGGEIQDEVKKIKNKSVELLKQRSFNLHMCNSNVSELENGKKFCSKF